MRTQATVVACAHFTGGSFGYVMGLRGKVLLRQQLQEVGGGRGNVLAVGAWLDNRGAKDAGAVQVHDLGSATPGVPMLTLLNPAPALNDSFGAALAVAGTRIIVGDHLDDAAATNARTVYAYDLTSDTPGTPVLTINNPAPSTGDDFGSSVAASGSRVVVAAADDDAGERGAGAVSDARAFGELSVQGLRDRVGVPARVRGHATATGALALHAQR